MHSILIEWGFYPHSILYLIIGNTLSDETNNLHLVNKTITFGTIPHAYDHVVEEGNTNQVVHKIKKLFEG